MIKHAPNSNGYYDNKTKMGFVATFRDMYGVFFILKYGFLFLVFFLFKIKLYSVVNVIKKN